MLPAQLKPTSLLEIRGSSTCTVMTNSAMHDQSLSPKISSLIPTLAVRIIGIIRRENLAVGHRLTESYLSEELNVSRSPVRKALQYLESLGLVSSVPNKGFSLSKAAHELAAIDLDPPGTSDEDLYLRIANDRIHGDLPEEVHESDLMEQFSTTRLQIQRVLHRMAREGMIDRKPGRGWVFRPLLTNSDSHRESYRFRMIIEPASILEPGYQADVVELEKCRREQEELLQGGIEKCSPAELFRAGVHLHETVVAGANNRFVLDSLRTINQMRRVVEYGTRLDRSRLHQQCREHLILIDLLLKGERMEAAHFLRQHLNGARISKIGEN
jgi:DNA-binding GntR family transcriptional regulator